jgi:lipid-A-disaccharide synthase
MPQARFAIAAFNDKLAAMVRDQVQATDLPVEIHVAKTAELIHRASCCMACSGSVSLELLYHEKPTVILYRITPFAFLVQRVMRRVKYITLVNLLASKNPFPDDLSTYDPDRANAEPVPFPEYLTCRDVSGRIAQHIVRWLADSERRAACVAQLSDLKAQFAHPGASTKAATYILDALSDSSQEPPKPVAA